MQPQLYLPTYFPIFIQCNFCSVIGLYFTSDMPFGWLKLLRACGQTNFVTICNDNIESNNYYKKMKLYYHGLSKHMVNLLACLLECFWVGIWRNSCFENFRICEWHFEHTDGFLVDENENAVSVITKYSYWQLFVFSQLVLIL
jgi:hypothetical protein